MFDINAAKKAGYSDDEIASYLSEQKKFDLENAKKAGYSSSEIIAHLTKEPEMKAAHEVQKETEEEYSQGIPSWYYTISDIARPTLEVTGMLAGGTIGTSAGIGGTVLGGALGFTAGSELADRLDEYLGIIKPKDMLSRVKRTGEKLIEGAEYEMGGQIIGKGIGYTAQKVDKLLRGKRIGLTRGSAIKKAGEKLEETTTKNPIYQKNIEEAQQLEKEIGGEIKFTRAQASNEPGIIKSERARFRMPGEAGTLGKEQFAAGQKAVKEYATKEFGGGKIESTIQSISAKQKAIEIKIVNTQKGVDALVENAKRGMSDIKAGETIKNTVLAKQAVARLRAGELYDEIPNVKLKSDKLLEAIDSLKGDFDPAVEKAANYPLKLVRGLRSKILKMSEPSRILDVSGREIPPKQELVDIGFQDLRKLRSTVLSEIRQAKSGLKPNDQLARRLNILNKAIETTLDSAGNLPGETGNLYRTASKFYRENYIEPFKQGTIKNILTKEATGAAKVRNSQVADMFLQPGELGIEVADDFYRAVGDDSLAHQAIKDNISHRMINNITDDAGNIVTKKLNSFIKNYEPALRKYGLYEEIKNLGNAQRLVDSAIETQNIFNRSAAARALGAAPENVVSEIFRGRDMVNPARTTRQIMDIIGKDKAAVKGFRTSVIEHIMKKAESTGVDFGEPQLLNSRLKKEIAKFAPVLRELYKDEPLKIKALNNIRKGIETLYRNQSSPIGGGSDTMENILNAAAEVGGPFFTKRYMLVNAIRTIGKMFTQYSESSVNALLNKAIFDPDLAYDLMFMASGKMNPKIMEKKISGQMSALSLYAGRQFGEFLTPSKREE